MESASVSEVKARLSYYLRLVRGGREVQIMDRGVPVARLVRYQNSEQEGLSALVEQGLLRRGSGDRSAALAPPPDLGVSLSEALNEDRADRL